MSKARISTKARYLQSWRNVFHARQIMVNDYETYITLARECRFQGKYKQAKRWLNEASYYRKRYGFSAFPKSNDAEYSFSDLYELKQLRQAL